MMDRPESESNEGPPDAWDAVREALDQDEVLTHVVPAIGCTLALSDRRLLVLRDGASFRPRTGFREWPVGPGLAVKPGVVRQGTGSLVIHWGRDITSVFVRADRWGEAIDVVAEVRRRLRRDGAAPD
jgi:hypothetical protein